jgi:DNA-binding SARP family transcriptional activator
MTGFEGAWVEDLREFLRSEQLALLHAAAEAARAEGDLDGATQLFRRMTEHEPYSELAWSGLADVWEERGDRVRAGEVRARFDRLMDEG